MFTALDKGEHAIHEAAERLARLATLGISRNFKRGAVLIHESDPSSQALFVVCTGRLRAFTTSDNGRELTLGIYGPGSFVGEMALDGGPRSASVDTLEPSVCALIDRPVLLRFIHDEPEFALDLLRNVIGKLRRTSLQARQLGLLDVYSRLCIWLEQHAGAPDAQGHRLIAEPCSQTHIAQSLGCTREMVSRLLRDLQQGQYISVQKRKTYLCKPLPARW